MSENVYDPTKFSERLRAARQEDVRRSLAPPPLTPEQQAARNLTAVRNRGTRVLRMAVDVATTLNEIDPPRAVKRIDLYSAERKAHPFIHRFVIRPTRTPAWVIKLYREGASNYESPSASYPGLALGKAGLLYAFYHANDKPTTGIMTEHTLIEEGVFGTGRNGTARNILQGNPDAGIIQGTITDMTALEALNQLGTAGWGKNREARLARSVDYLESCLTAFVANPATTPGD